MEAIIRTASPTAADPHDDRVLARRARRAVQRATRAALAVPVTDPAYDALTITDVSDLRGDLLALEERTAYWARVLRARARALLESRGGAEATGADLARPLRDAGHAHALLGRVDIEPVTDVERLPDLAEIWGRPLLPGDETGVRRLLRDLEVAAAAVDTFGAEVRLRRERATRELIARYRDQPSLALLPIARTLHAAPGRAGR